MRKFSLAVILLLTIGLLIVAIYISNDYKLDQTKIKPTKIVGTIEYDRLFAYDNFRQFKIVISQEEWDGLSQDIFDYAEKFNNYKVGNYRKADVYYTDHYGETVFKDVGIRTKGNTTRVPPEVDGQRYRFHFKLKFDEVFEDLLENENRKIKNRNLSGLTELNFKYHNGTDPSYVREIFALELFNKVGVLASNATLASVIYVIDGIEYDYGVYTIIEPIDKDFLTKRFGKERDDGNLYKCLWQNYGPASLEPATPLAIGIKDWETDYRPSYDLKTNKKEEDHSELKLFIENLNKIPDENFKAYIGETFDVDSFLRYQAMTLLIANPDDYWAMGNNYYLYFNNDGKIVFIPTDYDHSFGVGWGGEPVTSYEDLISADIYNYVSIDSGLMGRRKIRKPLVERILAIDEYREKYEDYLTLFIEESNQYFSYKEFNKTFGVLKKVYSQHTPDYFNEYARMLVMYEINFFEQKIRSVKSQLEGGLNHESTD